MLIASFIDIRMCEREVIEVDAGSGAGGSLA